MKPFLRLLILSTFTACAGIATAQTDQAAPKGDVILIADHVYITGGDVLTAQGNVEALQGDIRVQASQIVYNSRDNNVQVSGPIRMTQGDTILVLADFAEMDTQFQNGLLKSARVVLDRRLQLASQQLNRIDGRYQVLSKTAVTSCKVCDDGKPPLWQIRARRVVHDQKEKQIYFDDAQFRIWDIPVFYTPKLRLPDPTMTRATGFLIPQIRQHSRLGLGLKIPYFIHLGDDKDLTLTPYLATHTRTLEGRYRQAFRFGNIKLTGAVSQDSIGPTSTRYYLFGTGELNLPRDYTLTFDLKAASDDSYLSDYGYSSRDRLDSDVTAQRIKRDENTRFAFLHYQTLRDTEDNATLPTLIALAETERRFFPNFIGGEGRWKLKTQAHYRYSDLNIDGPDTDFIVDGRDVARANATVWWRRNWTLSGGLRTGVTSQLAFDAIQTDQDATRSDFDSQLTPSIAAHMRLPMSKTSANGITQILEPIAQIGWTGGDTLNVANDESTRVEFDEGNLLSLSKFPSSDRYERGRTAAVGLNWSRYDPQGWTAHLTLAQVYNQKTHPDFSLSSGLKGNRSDFLLAGQIKTKSGLDLTARGLFDAQSGINKAAARASWTNNKLWLEASYVWLGPDVVENRATTLAEWAMDSRYRLNRHWTGLADWRYDVANSSPAEAGIGLEYRNECVKIDFSVSRSFISSTTVQPSTSIGFTVALLGFSARSSDKSYARTCKNHAG